MVISNKNIVFIYKLVYKYFFVLAFFTYVLVFPSLFSFIDSEMKMEMVIVKAVFVFIMNIATCMLVKKIIDRIINNKGMTEILFCVGMFWVASNYLWNVNYLISSFCFLITLIAAYILCVYNSIYIACAILFFAVFFDHNFVNEYYIKILVLFLIKQYYESYDKRIVLNLKKICIVTIGYLVGNFYHLYRSTEELYANDLCFQFYIDYFKFGFVTRGMIGTIRHVLIGDEYNPVLFPLFVILTDCLCALSIIIILYFLFKRANNSFCKCIVFVYLISPSFRGFFEEKRVGYFDLCFSVLFFLSILFILRKKKNIYFIPILTYAAMCIHHVYASVAFPAIFLSLVIILLKTNKDSFRVRFDIIGIIIVTTLVVAISFFYFHYWAYNNVKIDFDSACYYFRENIRFGLPNKLPSELNSIELDDFSHLKCIKYVIYGGTKSGSKFASWIRDESIVNTSILWTLMIPIFVFFYKCFLNEFLCGKNKIYRLFIRIVPFSLFAILVSYTEIDYGRWNGFMITNTLMSMLVLFSGNISEKNRLYLKEFQVKVLMVYTFLLMFFYPTFSIFV